VDGSTLEQLVASRALGLHDSIGVLSAIAGAVQRMHDLLITHRNVRASNILVRTDGTPKLIGFGHVWPLAGANYLPPGMTGVSAEIDVRGLQELLGWIWATVGQRVPTMLKPVEVPGSVTTPGHFAEALDSYLQAT
jgi:serine/threonine protein kinase